MMGEEERKEDVERRVAEVLINIPDRVGSLKKYANSILDVVHYYFDRFGPYLPSPERKEWAKLALISDIVLLDMESIRNRVEVLETRIRKEALLGRDKQYRVPRKKLEKELDEIEANLEAIRKKARELLLKLLDHIEKIGIE